MYNAPLLGLQGCLPIVFVKNGKKGLKFNGKEIVAATFEEILPFQATLAIAKKKGKFGLIDATGKTILNFDNFRINNLINISLLTFFSVKFVISHHDMNLKKVLYAPI